MLHWLSLFLIFLSSHTIKVNLVEKDNTFHFIPGDITVKYGDTVEFIQSSNTMHNIDIKSLAVVSPYLVNKGEIYHMIIDSRFKLGIYDVTCDPHESIGMHMILRVVK